MSFPRAHSQGHRRNRRVVLRSKPREESRSLPSGVQQATGFIFRRPLSRSPSLPHDGVLYRASPARFVRNLPKSMEHLASGKNLCFPETPLPSGSGKQQPSEEAEPGKTRRDIKPTHKGNSLNVCDRELVSRIP